MRFSSFAKVQTLATLAVATLLPSALYAQQTITGQAAFADYTQQKPGTRRKITVADLPEPKPSESIDNGPSLIQRPEGAWPIAPAGFTVQLYAGGDAATPMQRSENKKETHPPTSGTFVMPRITHAAPNGDLFVADSQAGSILVLRGVAAEHGSWNRANRGGYEVIRIPMKDGKATGEYEDFLTGFVTPDGQVWGRPVGVAVSHDGALYVTDDGSRSIWRVT